MSVNKYVTIGKEKHYYNGIERDEYTWTYYKEYRCGKCHEEISKTANFCPHCGTKFNKEIEDRYEEKCRLKIEKKEKEKEEQINNVNPNNFEITKDKVEEIDREIKILKNFIESWDKFKNGSLPSNFEYCTK